MMKSKTSTQTQSRVLGVDPGFDRCGVAVLTREDGKDKLLFSTCITTSSKDTHEVRLLKIGDELRKIITQWKPNDLATEKLFFNVNARTALKVAEARGVILYEASRGGLSVYEYSPQSVKVAVAGYGKANKFQVESMVMRLLTLKSTPKHDDETDAIALGITHLASARSIWYK